MHTWLAGVLIAILVVLVGQTVLLQWQVGELRHEVVRVHQYMAARPVATQVAVPVPAPASQVGVAPAASTEQPAAAVASERSGSDIVHITRSGTKYHAAGCRYLSKSDIPISRSDAIRRGYSACSVCGGG